MKKFIISFNFSSFIFLDVLFIRRGNTAYNPFEVNINYKITLKFSINKINICEFARIRRIRRIRRSHNTEAIEDEASFDGFYAYVTSLDDDAVDVLRARSFHYEIEHLFRTTKSFLDARSVYLQRSDRIRSHFIICFLSMVILKILKKTARHARCVNRQTYRYNPRF